MPSTAPSQSGVSSPVSFVTASSEKLMLDEPALRTRRPCHAYSGLRSRWRSSSQGDEENQLQRVPVPSGNHPAGDLALRPVYPELSRRRRFVGGTRYHGVLRNCPALGEPLRTDDRGEPAQTPTQ